MHASVWWGGIMALTGALLVEICAFARQLAPRHTKIRSKIQIERRRVYVEQKMTMGVIIGNRVFFPVSWPGWGAKRCAAWPRLHGLRGAWSRRQQAWRGRDA